MTAPRLARDSGALAWACGLLIVLAIPGILLARVERGGVRLRAGGARLELRRHRHVPRRRAHARAEGPAAIRSAGSCWALPQRWGLDGLAGAYAGYSVNHDADLPGVRLAAAWASSWWPLWFALLGAILFLLPDGRLPSRRWRPVAVAGVVAVAAGPVRRPPRPRAAAQGPEGDRAVRGPPVEHLRDDARRRRHRHDRGPGSDRPRHGDPVPPRDEGGAGPAQVDRLRGRRCSRSRSHPGRSRAP